jgi:hypothetical protein
MLILNSIFLGPCWRGLFRFLIHWHRQPSTGNFWAIFPMRKGFTNSSLMDRLAHCTRPQGEWEGVWWFSVEPGEIGLTALEEAGDGINQDAKDRLAQLPAGLAQR